MPVLTVAEKDALRVENFIFHAVHHGQPDPTLFDEVPIGDFEAFFVGRVIDTLKGNRFTFEERSTTMAGLRAIDADPSAFVAVSKALATAFHIEDDRFKQGILIVLSLVTNGRRLYSLIKYDYGDRVLGIVERDAVAVLTAVAKPLTENKKALQKSALIELNEAGGELVVIDHSKRSGITDFFRDFLQVARTHSDAEMTTLLTKSLLRTVQAHLEELPEDIATGWRQKLDSIALRRLEFEQDQLFGDMFGEHGSAQIKDTFDENLAAAGLDGQSFRFNREALASAGPQKFRTSEGIEITVPEAAAGTFEKVKDGDDYVITIRTRSVVLK
ncbi:nucleoid-associated protein [Methylobacterium sp. V23]|uniref:nucleoid-associated protein n=1 Tax=Methylobacterium sp. V23 TaxID=2044878 RepID=UPI0015E1938E|nr:nucleoid-associated protein [Methylobacterium sp. V23]